jgi:hypothetical protein
LLCFTKVGSFCPDIHLRTHRLNSFNGLGLDFEIASPADFESIDFVREVLEKNFNTIAAHFAGKLVPNRKKARQHGDQVQKIQTFLRSNQILEYLVLPCYRPQKRDKQNDCRYDTTATPGTKFGAKRGRTKQTFSPDQEQLRVCIFICLII